MIYDGIKLIEGSALQNLVIATGTSFPSNADEGELFVRTDAGNAGLYVYQNSSWNKLLKVGDTVDGGGTAAGITDSIQYNVDGALAGTQSLRWTNASNTMTLGTAGGSNVTITAAGPAASAVAGTPLTVKAGTGGSAASGGELRLYGGDASGTTAPGGNVVIRGGAGKSAQPGGTVTIQGGFGEGGLAQGDGGQVILSGGYADQTSGNGDGGAVTIRGGLRGANTSAVGGPIIFQTSNSQTQVERFRILSDGAWSVGTAGNNVGSSGQVLTSQGAGAAPIWATPESFASNDTVTLSTNQSITGNKTFSNATTIFSISDNGPAFTRFVSSSTTQYFAGGLSVGITSASDTSARYTQIYQYNALANGAATGFAIAQADSNNAYVRSIFNYNYADQRLQLYTSGSVRQTINSDGTVLVGNLSTPVTQANGTQAGFSVANTEIGSSRMAVSIFRNDANSAGLTFTKSRGATAGTHGLVQNGDGLGFMPFEGSTGSAYARGAIISVVVDGTPSTTSMPGKLSFFTTPSGSTTPVERLAITASGALAVNSSTGTAGQVLTSQGNGSPPTWSSPSVTLQNNTIIGTVANTAVNFTGISGTDSSGTFTIKPGSTTSAGNTLVLAGGDTTSSGGGSLGGAVLIRGSDVTTAIAGGNVTIRGGNNSGSGSGVSASTGGSVSINGGTSTNGSGGSLSLTAGNAAGLANAYTGGNISLTAGNGSGGGSGGNITITSGAGSTGGGQGGTVTIAGANGSSGINAGSVTVQSGDGTHNPGTLTLRGSNISSGTGNGGQVQINGGSASGNAGTPRNGGNVSIVGGSSGSGGLGGQTTISGGNSTQSGGTGGSVQISGGTGAVSGGSIKFRTSPTTTAVDRLEITSTGAWSVNSSAGTAGQVLVSNGSTSSPTWQDLPSPTKLERVTTFDANARGKRVALSAGVTIPSGTYAAGDAFSFYNTTGSAVTITQGASLTLRQDGTTNTGDRSLAPYGTCFVWFNTANEAVISGSVS